MTRETDPEVWVIALVPLASEVPDAVRVKQLLKTALRRFGLRCVTVRYPRPEELAAVLAEQGDRP